MWNLYTVLTKGDTTVEIWVDKGEEEGLGSGGSKLWEGNYMGETTERWGLF